MGQKCVQSQKRVKHPRCDEMEEPMAKEETCNMKICQIRAYIVYYNRRQKDRCTFLSGM